MKQPLCDFCHLLNPRRARWVWSIVPLNGDMKVHGPERHSCPEHGRLAADWALEAAKARNAAFTAVQLEDSQE